MMSALAWFRNGRAAGALLLALLWPFAWAQGVGNWRADTAQAQTEYARVQLLVHAPQGIAAGRPVWLGVRIDHAPEWHTYWRNPGDSGLPIELQWQLPAGVTAGEVAWPTPRKFPIGELANYGYDGTVLLPVPLTVAPEFSAPTLDVQLQASWLICRRECVPEEAQLRLRVPTNGSIVQDGALFETALAAVPRPIDATGELRVRSDRLQLQVSGLPANWRGQPLDFFPEVPNIIAPGAAWEQRWDGDRWTALVPLTPYRTEAPTQLAFVLAPAAPAGHGLREAGVRLDWPVQGQWPVPAAAAPAPLDAAGTTNAPVPAATPEPVAASSPTPLGLVLALLGALLGGMALNLMPCVFPVLAIKVMAFQAHGRDARAHRIGALAYTAGVLLSFTALGALLLALRAGGEAVGWGFQLQNPVVVAGLATLFAVIGLNLAGLFEFGQWAPAGLASLQLRHPVADAFLTGVLASVIASPCTAPLMGASLGLAVTLPTAPALAIFALLGLGMALPYLAASLWPALVRRLPRPGPWMEVFRQAMAFPMLATVVWLLWVLGQQSGVHAVAALLLMLLTLAWLLWALGRRGRARPWLVAAGVLMLAGTVLTLGPWAVREAPESAQASRADELWAPWSPQRQDELLAAGRPVFVDFTAAWCVTCQVNKAAVLGRADVLQEAAAANIALLRADWTRRDPVIAQALAALGRSGVPVYVLYVPGKAPLVLNEILSVDAVRAAFRTAGQG